MQRSKGSILIFVLVISTCMSLLVLGAWQIGWGCKKSMSTYQEMMSERQALEAQMLVLEGELYSHTTYDATWIQFVPDTLAYGETQGVDYYRLELFTGDGSGTLTTTQGIRRIP